jgi:hypothetical protein
LSETLDIKLVTYFEVSASWIGESLDIWGKCKIFKWNNKIRQYINQQTVTYKNTVAPRFIWQAENTKRRHELKAKEGIIRRV